MTIKFGSLFSGIGGFDLGLERAGMRCAWQVEIDKAASQVLKRHWPDVPNLGDVKNVTTGIEPVELICGGFPCQDVSIAGQRAGLTGERSGLWYEFARIIAELKPRWVIIENVPGLLSSNGGKDMETVVRSLVECGYGVAWRVLDAQYFGLAQRRRRVFIVASLGNGRAAQVLFEREGMSGDFAKGSTTRKEIAGTLDGKSASSCRGSQANELDFIVAEAVTHSGGQTLKLGDKANTINTQTGSETTAMFQGRLETLKAAPLMARQSKGGFTDPVNDNILAVSYNIQQNDGGEHKRKDRPNGGMYVTEAEKALTVGTTDLTVVWQNRQQSGEIRSYDGTVPTVSQQWGTGGNNVPFVLPTSPSVTFDQMVDIILEVGKSLPNPGVRRLTPTECERLQGFPDGWTDEQSDSARYRQLGNAVAVPVIEWLGRRIMEIDT